MVPNIHWIDSMHYLIRRGLLSERSMFVNGQSGDFIAGNHIPMNIGPQCSLQFLCERIIEKHFALIRPLQRSERNKREISEKIIETLKSIARVVVNDAQSLAKYYELWEWQERQCKRVVQGQRSYDFFGFSWRLPLWENEYLYFWRSIPLEYKLRRTLFRRYLAVKDFYGLFRKFQPRLSRWPRRLLFVEYIGKSLKLALGSGVSDAYYRYLDYFSQYSILYSPFGYLEFARSSRDFKDVMPFYGRVWEAENLVCTGEIES